MCAERALPKFDADSVKITKEEGFTLYEDMVLGRLFEDKCAEMYYRGKMFGFVHLYNGQEAVSSGIIKALRDKGDYVSSTYRDHVHALSSGVPANEVMAELFGKETGCSKGRGGSMHMFSAEHGLLRRLCICSRRNSRSDGSSICKVSTAVRQWDKRSSDSVSVCFFGDGASNNGQFFECLNMAALWKLPSDLCCRKQQVGNRNGSRSRDFSNRNL